jgi:nicastrin
VVLLPASASNPGIPPSSLTSFLRHKPSIQGVVIEEFDTSFSNTYYQSEADTPEFINAEPILAAGKII